MPQEYSNEKLVELIRSGTDPAGHMLQLWQQNRGLIGKVAGRYKGYEDAEDLKQQGYIGLCDAVRGYDPEKGIPFANYAAYWIRQSMTRYIENNGAVVRIPSHQQQKQREYKKFLHTFELYTGRTPADYEICYYLGMDESSLQDIRDSIRIKQAGSLDVHIGEDGDVTVGDLVPDDKDMEDSVLSEIEKEELEKILWPMVDGLPEGRGQVIRLLYREEKTLKAAGDVLGIPKERVRRMKEKALREMRYSEMGQALRAFLPEALGSMAYGHNGICEFNCTWTSSTELAALKMC
ncbi:MAG: sigma-70 family RNA polymerase sigma factor [Lachnospiraceae bacterium]|nr:sigma-70 family RNA polymerase sigma factor [Lachnospiraceae bacterium]